VRDRSSYCEDQFRVGGVSTYSGAELGAPVSSKGPSSPRRENKFPSSGNQLKCYLCGKPGHTQRRCFLRSASRGEPAGSNLL
jgi:hypothetical protein